MTPPCERCGHPDSWHRHDDYAEANQGGHGAHGQDPYAGCPFRCVGYDVTVDGPAPVDPCTCPDYVEPR